MNKQELIASMAANSDLTKVQAAVALEAFLDTVVETLKAGDDVKMPGFGSFMVSRSEAKMGRNPQTGAPMEIKSSNRARFKVGKTLKEAVQ